jgi:hypothetical protein
MIFPNAAQITDYIVESPYDNIISGLEGHKLTYILIRDRDGT